MKCPNCDESNERGAKFCVECGSNMEDRRYSRDDDPTKRIDRLEKKLDRLLSYVESDEEEDDDGKKDEDETPRSRKRTANGRGKDERKVERKGGFFRS